MLAAANHPEPVRAALMAAGAGADGITAHLREDRRHIRDEDLTILMNELSIPLNLEMAATDEMLDIALQATNRMRPVSCRKIGKNGRPKAGLMQRVIITG